MYTFLYLMLSLFVGDQNELPEIMVHHRPVELPTVRRVQRVRS